uniref:ShKT domain-containing protein n=1 Tax=Angiostrongylus cantonensis TaxID=6313 RepID=A0A0K0D8S4_ANGCA
LSQISFLSTVELYVCFSCDHWRSNGFCNNTFYSTAQRRFYCGKACGLSIASNSTV